MSDNEGNAIVVTGAGSGIGKATVNRLANDGANVVAVDVTESSLEWTKEFDSVTPLAGDVTDPNINEKMVALAVQTTGV